MTASARTVVAGTSAWLERAGRAFRQARFADAVALIDGAEAQSPAAFPPEAALLRARVRLKREPGAALEDLARHRAAWSGPSLRAEADMLAGAAYARLGDYASAETKLGAAARGAPAGSALALEVGYQRALAFWMERRLDEALRDLDAVQPHASDTLGVECRVLRGVVAASRGHIREQAVILLECLPLVRAGDRSVLHHAVVASQIAYLARELPSAELRAQAYAELPRVDWTPDIADFRYTALRAAAWCHALEGDDFNAFRKLKEAAAVAPSAAWRVMSSCDRAYLATVLGEPRWAEQELRDAHELASAVEWNVLDGEERFALALLAELFAPRDGALALSYIAKYRATGNRYARTLASSNDRRVTAMEAYSFGVVQRYLGDKDEATRLISDAWNIYDDIGYDWRAGRAALALAEMSGDEAWRRRAQEKLGFYRRSWLAQSVSASSAQPSDAFLRLSRLTPAQRAVFELLLQGTSIRRIAQELERTENTVRNHVKAIFKTFGVNSRASLMARANGSLRNASLK